MVDAAAAFAHEHRLVLLGERLLMVAEDVRESGEQSQALGDLSVHRPVDVVQQVQRLAHQLVAGAQLALLDLRLPRLVEVERVRRLQSTVGFVRN